jgi:hypothetical protein
MFAQYVSYLHNVATFRRSVGTSLSQEQQQSAQAAR